MAYSLAPAAIEQGYRLEAHESVGSTNVVALERAREGDRGPLWIVARRQESGRGRRGRAWETGQGNLAATLLLADGIDLTRAATLGFVAGLALSDAMAAVAPSLGLAVGVDGADIAAGGRIELKWPNDVLANGAKLAGILLESALLPDGRAAVAIGIGVNVVAHPQAVSYPVTSLRQLGVDCDAERLFFALSDAWVDNVVRWQGGRDLGDVRTRWLARAAGLGGEVAVRLDGRVVRGRFETIDEACRFVIRGHDGERIIVAAGDVHFGAVASLAAAG